MFNIYLHEPGAPLPPDDICYIIGKNGIFMKKKMGAVETLAKVDAISILEEVKPYAKFDLPKIPIHIFSQVVSFVRSVYDDMKSESMVLIFFNPTTNEFIMHAPKQEVTGGGIKYERDYVIEGFNNVGTIHSHAGMSAFHSGVDIDDEKDTDGIHITIGKCGEKSYFDATASLAFNGTRFPINVIDYVEGLHYKEIVEEVVIPSYMTYGYGGYGHVYGIGRYQNGISSFFPGEDVQETKPEKKYRKVPGYVLDVSLDAIAHPGQWDEMVSKPSPIVYSSTYNNCNPYSFGARSGFNDEQWKKQLERNQSHIDRTFMSPEVSELFDMEGFEFLPSDIDNMGFNPCHECIFVNHKITMEEEGELDDDVPDFDGDDYNFITKEQLDLLRKGGD